MMDFKTIIRYQLKQIKPDVKIPFEINDKDFFASSIASVANTLSFQV